MSDQQKTETETKTEGSDNRNSMGRLLKAFDKVQEDTALINYLLAKRDVREKLTRDQIVELAHQSNATVSSLNAVSVLLDGIMPRRVRSLSMNVVGGESAEGGESLLDEVRRRDPAVR